MRETKIRFGKRAWELIQKEAELDGCSASQFVREAAIARAIHARYQRGEIEPGETFEGIIDWLRSRE